MQRNDSSSLTDAAAFSTTASAAAASTLMPQEMQSVLRPHQIAAIDFIWEKLVRGGFLHVQECSHFTSIEQRQALFREVHGCVVGHSMGLGKTITTICFLALFHNFLSQSAAASYGGAASHTNVNHPGLKCNTADALRVMVIAPKSCVLHWFRLLQRWLEPTRKALNHHSSGGVNHYVATEALEVHRLVLSRPGPILEAYYTRGGVLLLSYEEYVALVTGLAGTSPPVARHQCRSFFDRLRVPLPSPSGRSGGASYLDMLSSADLLIVDEAHRLRRDSSKFVSLLRLHVQSISLRIALTGTPIQNHLTEYNVMQSVVTGAPVDATTFSRLFVQPIETGQCVDSTYQQFVAMQECVAALRKFFSHTVHHVGPEVLEHELPPRVECVFFFELSEEQKRMYEAALAVFEKYHRSSGSFASALHFHHEASHIACHPSLCRVVGRVPLRWRKRERDANGTHDPVIREEADDEGDEGEEEEEAEAVEEGQRDAEEFNTQSSAKLFFAVELVSHLVKTVKEKVVVFSQYKRHLKLVQRILRQHYQVDALIFSGDLSDVERESVMQQLNTGDCQVLLCSKKAGGVGIDLSGANHCILMDVCWNPSDDVQAGYRVYRYGQTRPVTIYRLAAEGTTEQVVFAYALQKTWLQKKIADVKDPERQQRHRTESYFEFPCRVSVRPPRSLAELKRATSLTAEERVQRRGDLLLQWCDEHCSTAAHVFHSHPSLLPFLSNAVKHAFLLRDDSAEVMKQVGRRFQSRNLPLLPAHSPLSSPNAAAAGSPPVGGASSSGAVASNRTAGVEKRLLSKARRAAARCVYGILRDGASTSSHRRSYPVSSEDFTEEEVMSSAELLRRLWSSFLPTGRSAAHFDDWWLQVYQLGAASLSERVLSSPHIAYFRSVLLQSLIVDEGSSSSGSGAVGDTSLLHALQFTPHRLLEPLSGVNEMYLAIELGLPRPLVSQSFFIGFSKVAREALERFKKNHEGQYEPLMTLRRSEDESEDDIIERVLGYLDEVWPAYTGFKRPRLPFDRVKEEQLVQRTLLRARSSSSLHSRQNPNPRRLLSRQEVVTVLKLQLYHGDHNLLACPRCSALLSDVAASGNAAAISSCRSGAMRCSKCHFNTSFSVQTHPSFEHHAMIFQLALVLNLLDAFSVSRSFCCAAIVAAATHTTVLETLRYREETQVPVLQVAERCLKLGSEEFCRIYSSDLVKMIVIECGAEDVSQLPRLLVANGRLLWQTNTRESLRRRVTEETRLLFPHWGQQIPSLPALLLFIAFQEAVRAVHARYACELISGVNHGEESPSFQLLRFISESLVKLKYLEKVLANEKRSSSGALASKHLPVAAADDEEGKRLSSPTDSIGELLAESFSEEDEAPQPLPCGPPSTSIPLPEEARDEMSIEMEDVEAPSEESPDDDAPSVRLASSGSSFGSCYSADRESFGSGSSGDREGELPDLENQEPDGTSRQPPSSSLPEELDEEAKTQQDLRAACFWAAHCEVYGTYQSVSLEVMVDDGVRAERLPTPSPIAWGPLLEDPTTTTVKGLTIQEVVDVFWRRLESLARGVPLL